MSSTMFYVYTLAILLGELPDNNKTTQTHALTIQCLIFWM